jgi:hypothetical protein
LVLLRALVLEQFKEAPFGFVVEGLYEGEALASRLSLVPIFVAPKAQHAFASDHFKMAFLAGRSDKAAVDPHCQRTVRWREPIPVALTALDKTALFLT